MVELAIVEKRAPSARNCNGWPQKRPTYGSYHASARCGTGVPQSILSILSVTYQYQVRTYPSMTRITRLGTRVPQFIVSILGVPY